MRERKKNRTRELKSERERKRKEERWTRGTEDHDLKSIDTDTNINTFKHKMQSL